MAPRHLVKQRRQMAAEWRLQPCALASASKINFTCQPRLLTLNTACISLLLYRLSLHKSLYQLRLLLCIALARNKSAFPPDTPLMFRISTANRAAQLRSVTAVQGLRFFHRTTSVHVSFPKTVLRSSRSVDTATVDAAPGKDVDQSPDVKPAAGQSSNETLPNEPFIEPKRRLGRPRKDPADNTITKYRRKAKDGGNADEGTKATKARKRTAAKNDTSRDPDSAPGDSSLQEDRPAAAEYGRPALARPKNPSDNMIDWLSWGYGGTWKGGSSIGDRRRMNVVSEDLCGKSGTVLYARCL